MSTPPNGPNGPPQQPPPPQPPAIPLTMHGGRPQPASARSAFILGPLVPHSLVPAAPGSSTTRFGSPSPVPSSRFASGFGAGFAPPPPPPLNLFGSPSPLGAACRFGSGSSRAGGFFASGGPSDSRDTCGGRFGRGLDAPPSSSAALNSARQLIRLGGFEFNFSFSLAAPSFVSGPAPSALAFGPAPNSGGAWGHHHSVSGFGAPMASSHHQQQSELGFVSGGVGSVSGRSHRTRQFTSAPSAPASQSAAAPPGFPSAPPPSSASSSSPGGGPGLDPCLGDLARGSGAGSGVFGPAAVDVPPPVEEIAGSLYGRPQLHRWGGGWRFQPTFRMEAWLRGLEELTLEDREPQAQGQEGVQRQQQYVNMEEGVDVSAPALAGEMEQRGEKRGLPTEDEPVPTGAASASADVADAAMLPPSSEPAAGAPAAKRSRTTAAASSFADSIRRAVSRVGQNTIGTIGVSSRKHHRRANTALAGGQAQSAALTANTLAKFDGSEGKTGRRRAASAGAASIFLGAAAATVVTAGSVKERVRRVFGSGSGGGGGGGGGCSSAILETQPHLRRQDTPFRDRTPEPGAALALAGRYKRKIKICLLGDVGSGKTAFLNRVITGVYNETTPTQVPDLRFCEIDGDNGDVIGVEIWDFPGLVTSGSPGSQLSTFFDVAIICFSLEDAENVNNITEIWKPKLDHSLHDGSIYLIGMKKDLRPEYPRLELEFLPDKKPVTKEMGHEVAKKIGAEAYFECSAKEGNDTAWIVEAIVHQVCDMHDERERKRRAEQSLGNRAKETLSKAFKFGFGKK